MPHRRAPEPLQVLDVHRGRPVAASERLHRWDTVAYVVLSYRLPGQVARLVETVKRESPRAAVLVHHDSADPVPLGGLPDTDGVFLVTNPRHLPWGGWELGECILDTTRWVHRHLATSWTSVLSGQDWPVLPLPAAERRLAGAGVDAFVRAEPIGWTLRGQRPPRGADHVRWLMLRRYLFHYRTLPVPRPAALRPRGVAPGAPGQGGRPSTLRRLKRRLAVANQRARLVTVSEVPTRLDVGIRARRPPFDPETPVWFGSCWYDLSRRAVDRMLTHLDPGGTWYRWFRRTEIADEAMFATVLANDRALAVVHDDNHRFLRWEVDWSPSPAVLAEADLDAVLASGATFARKFDTARHPGVIDALERRRHRAGDRNAAPPGGAPPAGAVR